MSGSHYWASLRGAGIFIYLSLFGLFLGTVLLGAFYDRISTFQIWNAPVWLKIKTPLIILGVAGFLVTLIAYIRYEGLKELEEVRKYAQDQCWEFSRDDRQGLTARVSAILDDLKIDLHYIRTVETGQRSLYLFDCRYKHREAAARVRESSGTACLVKSGHFRSVGVPVEIEMRDWTEMMVSDKVDMGQSPFAEKFIVLSSDPASAQKIVNESLQSLLLEHMKKPLPTPVSVTIGPGGAVVLTDRTSENQRLQDLINLARQIESVVE